MPDPDLTLLTSLVEKKLREYNLAPEPLNMGGGGGTSGGMEARVARLESDMEHVKKSVADIAMDVKAVRTSLGDVKVELGRFDERLKTMPTKGFILTASAAIVAATSGIIGLVLRFLP
jgi:outer membrane murein-binding lipoprotein Lpp